MTYTISQKKGPHGMLLVIIDTNILNNKYTEGNKQLDLTAEFYQGEKMNKKQVTEQLIKARDIHATGKNSVGILVEKEIVNPNNIIYIEGIPHAQIAN